MQLLSNRGLFGSLTFLILIVSVIAINPDEEDELLDEIIPHQISKRKFYSPSKRQFIQQGYGSTDAGALEQMPQPPVEQFAGNTEQLPAALSDQTQSPMEQTIGQGQLEQTVGQGQSQVEQLLGGGAPQSSVSQQFTQVDSGAQAQPVAEQTKNYDPNSVTEMSMGNNGYKVTTDQKEKANHLASDVKDFGLWEYSADSSAPSTDQTAKLLQNKLLDEDKSFQGQDSASLNVNQLANAQGSKVDTLLDLFNQGTLQNNPAKELDSIESATKGLEAYDSATKGFSAMDGVGKNFLSTGKGIDDSNMDSQTNDYPTQQQNTPSDVSVVNLPNSYSLEDEHGHSLDSENTAHKPGHAGKNGKMMQILRKLLKNKIRAQAARLIMKHKNNHDQLLSSLNPLKRISKLLTQPSQDADSPHSVDTATNPVISTTELKLLGYIKHMLNGGGSDREHKGINEDQMKAFMGALSESVGPKSGGQDTAGITDKSASNQQKQSKEGNTNSTEKTHESSTDETHESSTEKTHESSAEKTHESSNEKAETSGKEKPDGKDADKTTTETGKTSKEPSKNNKAGASEKLKAIQAILKQIKPTARSGHGSFYLDPEEPLGNTGAGNSNTLMNYLEHETALVDQFQEGSQIGDPAQQLKHLAQLMINIANKAKPKDALIDARRTTVSPKQVSATEKSRVESEDVKQTKNETKIEDDKSKELANDKQNDKSETDKKEAAKSNNEKEKQEEKTKENEKQNDKQNEKEIDKQNLKENDKQNEKENDKQKEKENDKQNEKENFKQNEKENYKQSGKENDKQNEKEFDKQNGKENDKQSGKENDKQNGNENDKGKQKGNESAGTQNDLEKEKSFGKHEGNGETSLQNKATKDNDETNSEKDKEKEKSVDKNQSNKIDDQVKEDKKMPEMERARNNKKIVTKVNDEKDMSHSEENHFSNNNKESSSKLDDKTSSASKGADNDNKNDDNIKTVKNLPELAKLRNNKKIVAKIDNNEEKATSQFKSENKEGSSKQVANESMQSKNIENTNDKDNSPSKGRFEQSSHDDKESEKGKDSGKNEFHTQESSHDKTFSKGKEGDKIGQENENKSSGHSVADNKEQPKSTQRDEGVSHDEEQKDRPKGNEKQEIQPSGHISPGRAMQNGNSSESHLTPQLPFLNPGRAHLDVLESDQSLKQYLMQKGKDDTSSRHDSPNSNTENFDNDDGGKLLHVKDVTGIAKGIIKKPNARPKLVSSKYKSTFTPNSIPPAGQGLPFGSKAHGRHAIRPITRSLWNKYKKMLSRIHLPVHDASISESNAGPILATKLNDASIRYAAIARLIAMAKERHRMIDVAAAKKSLPDRPERLHLNTANDKQETDKVSVRYDAPMITSFFKSPQGNKAVLLPTKGLKLNVNDEGNAVLIPVKHRIEAEPADEQSRLLSHARSVEVGSIVDPSDVTRSQLEKPNKPSINQVMDMLEPQQSANRNRTASDSTKQATNNKEGPIESNKPSISAISESESVSSAASANVPVERLASKIGSEIEKIKKIDGLDTAKVDETGSSLAAKAKYSEPHAKTRIRPIGKPQVLVPVHEHESGKGFIRKKDARDLIQTLKADIESANFLLRKRSQVPRARKSRKGKRRLK